ncbi:hypothetical protein BX286_3557 [Streptomyces sp. 3211.6]|uniref:hypothetical protein n=1 Tax=Streptomyces TaxID=1883 RepID=UPI000CB6A3D8|nr:MULTISPECIES: hypothetical protein [Streptomyces]RKT05557.1 hypothetical protein BX286_3557 [Streptomyces sp. 3211.6]RPF41492.1 hypothetical protein EDD96_5296 [Streptomyces sp. Ag109_G2-6]
METLVLVGVIILAIAVGARWIHLLNAQHDARIAVYHFSDPLPRPPGLPDDTGRRAHRTDARRRGTHLPPAGGSGRVASAPRPVDRGAHSDET